jgi:hypothetical protein
MTFLKWPLILAIAAFLAVKGFVTPLSLPVSSGGEIQRRDARGISFYEKLQIQTLLDIEDPIRGETRVFQVAIRQAFEAGRFDRLEQEAAKLRRSGEKFGDGEFKLDLFYRALVESPDNTEKRYQRDFARFAEWGRAHPQSLTKSIALSHLYNAYAWDARGTDWAHKVTEEGWRLMRERLEKSMKELATVQHLQREDPEWFDAILRVGLGLGLESRMMDKIVTEARALHPGYWPIECSRAHSLLPRWYGEAGEWEAFAEASANLTTDPGDEVYARILLRLDPFHNDIFRESGVSWPKARKGFELMMQRYPESLEIRSAAARLGTMAGDFAFAKEQFSAIGKEYHASVWDDGNEFVIYRTAARRGRW